MMTQASVGTIPYMAPEQIQAHPRPASDQYALELRSLSVLFQTFNAFDLLKIPGIFGVRSAEPGIEDFFGDGICG